MQDFVPPSITANRYVEIVKCSRLARHVRATSQRHDHSTQLTRARSSLAMKLWRQLRAIDPIPEMKESSHIRTCWSHNSLNRYRNASSGHHPWKSFHGKCASRCSGTGFCFELVSMFDRRSFAYSEVLFKSPFSRPPYSPHLELQTSTIPNVWCSHKTSHLSWSCDE